MDVDESRPTAQALGSATYGACQHVLRFSVEVVAPIIQQRTARNPMFAPLACRAMFQRIHAWLLTFDSLSNPAHFQAVQSGSRAMFELAVDLTLIHLKEKGSFKTLINWQQSAKLHWAERKVRHDSNDKDAGEYIAKEGPPMRKLREETWGSAKHQSRWTGNSLEADAIAAEGFRQTGFKDYYNEQYTLACWLVHGSGVIGMLETPPHMIPYLGARGYRDAGRFSVASLRLLLELLDAYSHAIDEQFGELHHRIVEAEHATLRLHEQLQREQTYTDLQ